MGFGEAISTCFRKYVDFKGRASRSEYWYWFLFTVLLAFVAGFFDAAAKMGESSSDDSGIDPLSTLVSFATFLPTIAVTVRRLHDTGRSGLWYLGFIVALILSLGVLAVGVSMDNEGGAIAAIAGFAMLGLFVWAIVILASAGERGANRFGPPVTATDTPSPTGALDLNDVRNAARVAHPVGMRSGTGSRWVLSGFDSSGNVVRLEFYFSANRDSFVIGRNSTDCDLVISDDGVSRRHAELSMTSAGLTIRDLGSANGTTLDGRPVPSTHAVPMPSTGTLRVGPVDLGIFGS
jgi:uncharacterized membrane protein YhaH (DUF805 family)